MQVIEFLYDFGSPNAYLVECVLPKIAARHDVKIRRIPVLLGGIFKETGNMTPITRYSDLPQRVDYMRLEMDRFIKRHGISFQWTPHFPILSHHLMRGAIFAQGKEWESKYREAVYRHCWIEGSNMTDPEVIADVLTSEGLPSTEIMAATQDPQIKAALFQRTKDAVDRQVFGIPTMFVGTEMFFGKDSLGDLEYHLTSMP